VFQSTITLLAASLITFLVILFYCLRQNPFPVIIACTRDLVRHRLMLFHLLGGSSILVMNKLELMLEPELREEVNDWTAYIRAFEENVTPLVQEMFQHPMLTQVTTFFYVVVFSVLMFVSLLVYHREGDFRSWYALVYGISCNYFLAIPFFLFAPVMEAWTSHPDIQFLIPEVYPRFELEYRYFSGMDNSFPSLHTSISVTMAMIALHSENRRLAGVSLLSAGVILLSILYLGIHWWVDLIGGFVLASISVGLAFRLGVLPLGSHQLKLRAHRKNLGTYVPPSLIVPLLDRK